MNTLSSNSEINKELEFLKEISAIQAQLFSPGIESRFSNEEEKKQFKRFRLKWSLFVGTVQIDIATVLVNELEENQVDFKDGIEAINEKIQDINDTVDFLNLLERGLNILGRIIDLTI
jgi:hypothetical protein